MEEQLRNYVRQLYVDNYARFLYYKAIEDKTGKINFYDGRNSLLLNAFSNQLGTDSEIEELRIKSQAKVDEILEFMNN